MERTIEAGGRRFQLWALRFDNGNFVSVTEGGARLGSMEVSMAASVPKPITTTIIPSKNNSVFIRLVAEKISTTTRGISIVSVNVSGEIGTDPARKIIAAIAEMIRNV